MHDAAIWAHAAVLFFAGERLLDEIDQFGCALNYQVRRHAVLAFWNRFYCHIPFSSTIRQHNASVRHWENLKSFHAESAERTQSPQGKPFGRVGRPIGRGHMGLDEYKRKRNFSRTPEPAGGVARGGKAK